MDAFWAIVGLVGGLLVALLVQPLLQDSAQSFLVRMLGRWHWLRRPSDLGGDWMFVWEYDGSSAVGRQDETKLELRTVGRRVAGRFDWKGRTYQLIGNRHTSDYVTGTYVDEVDGYVFHGAFQLRILPGDQLMEGRWMGFNSHHAIVQGPWYLRRAIAAKYSFE